MGLTVRFWYFCHWYWLYFYVRRKRKSERGYYPATLTVEVVSRNFIYGKQRDEIVLRIQASTRKLQRPDKHPFTANVWETMRFSWNPVPIVGSTSGIMIPCLVSKTTRIVDYGRVDFCKLERQMARQTTKETSNVKRQARWMVSCRQPLY
jgi:hypothetical protein